MVTLRQEIIIPALDDRATTASYLIQMSKILYARIVSKSLSLGSVIGFGLGWETRI